MRRPLARATAACAASALALSLWAVVPATAGEEAPTATDGTAASGERGIEVERVGEQGKSAAPVLAHAGRGRIETETSRWTYVDRAFPHQDYDDAEIASVGTGRLEWDRVYTRRALLRFPVELDPGAVVESAVLRVEVAWSYDCHSPSHVQLHRIDPFDAEATWNDQPTAHALLDTQAVEGGRPTCPVDGGVEFDATEAYRWAVHNGESHLHLRLKERGEAGTTAWRRFRVEGAAPVLVVDHRTPPTGAAAPEPSDLRNTVDSGEEFPGPLPSGGSEGSALPGDGIASVTETDTVLTPGPVPAHRAPNESAQARSGKRTSADRPVAPQGGRQRDGDDLRRARGPPGPAKVGDRTPMHRPQGTG